MPRSAWTLLPALLLACFLLAPPAPADDIDEATAGKQVSELLATSPGEDPRAIWALSESLARGGKPAIRPLAEAVEGAGATRRLAIGRALLLLEDYVRGLTALRSVASDTKAEATLRAAAVDLIGEEGELEDAEWLEDQIDTTLEPHVKMAMAKALWNLNFTNKKKGKEVLLAFMRSTDEDLRAEGALALGEIGDAGAARTVLEELRLEPTERGRSAAFLLEILKLERLRESAYRVPREDDPPLPDPDLGAEEPGRWPLLDELYHTLKNLYVDEDKLDHDALEDAMAAGISAALDPFTSYLSPEAHAKLREGLDPTYGGVGAYVHNDPQNQERFTISRPIWGGPLYRAGLRSGDIILDIDGTSTEGLSVEECVRLLKGPPGTAVTITVYRRGWDEGRPYTLNRARITIPTTAWAVLPGDIGFLQVVSFSQDTAQEVGKVLDRFEAAGVKALILDLRFNGGGFLHTAVEIASEFLPRGTLVVREKGREGVYDEKKHFSTGTWLRRPGLAKVPIVILINQATASAGEILAGALRQQREDVRLVGTMSYGKGSVQRPWDLASRSGEPFTDEARERPTYEDSNANGQYDPGEPVRLVKEKNGRWDDAERFDDRNGNGMWDPGEEFQDENYNRRWDPAEPFEDENGNGKWDPGANLKLTIAAYYLPDGTRLQRKSEVKDGKLVTTGGLEPDVEVNPAFIDFWELQAQRKLESGKEVEAYVDRLFAEHPKLVGELASSDAQDVTRYPGFEEFWSGLDTRLDREAVRFLVRYNIRRRIGDELGRELVGDVVDDVELQAGVNALFGLLGKDIEKDDAYAFVARVLAEREAKKKEREDKTMK